MHRLFQSFLLRLATATDRELARQLQSLKVENAILRAKLPQRIIITPRERQRLIQFGKVLSSTIRDLITIISPRTFRRWLHEEKPATKPSPRKPGRPKTKEEIREVFV